MAVSPWRCTPSVSAGNHPWCGAKSGPISGSRTCPPCACPDRTTSAPRSAYWTRNSGRWASSTVGPGADSSSNRSSTAAGWAGVRPSTTATRRSSSPATVTSVPRISRLVASSRRTVTPASSSPASSSPRRAESPSWLPSTKKVGAIPLRCSASSRTGPRSVVRMSIMSPVSATRSTSRCSISAASRSWKSPWSAACRSETCAIRSPPSGVAATSTVCSVTTSRRLSQSSQPAPSSSTSAATSAPTTRRWPRARPVPARLGATDSGALTAR